MKNSRFFGSPLIYIFVLLMIGQRRNDCICSKALLPLLFRTLSDLLCGSRKLLVWRSCHIYHTIVRCTTLLSILLRSSLIFLRYLRRGAVARSTTLLLVLVHMSSTKNFFVSCCCHIYRTIVRCTTLWPVWYLRWCAVVRSIVQEPLNLRQSLRVGSIPTLHLKTFEQIYWTTTWRKNSRKAQWQAQSRYLCHCAFLISFRYAGSEKTWPKHFISISLALVTLLTVLRR